jgi:hypothetical protein
LFLLGFKMKESLRQSGFTLIETMIGMGLLIGLGVMGLKLSQSMQQSSSGIKKMSAMTKVMIQMRTMTANADACTLNFKNKGVGETIQVIRGKNDEPMVQVGTKMENDTIRVREMKVEKLMPERKRAQISISFERLSRDGRAKDAKKVMNIMANIQSGRIVECLDFGGMLDDSLVNKLCWDADPENFDSEPNDNFDCTDNVAHLVAEIKSIYCRENGLVGDPTTGVCRPLDFEKNCPSGSYLRGFLGDGSLDCYTPEPPDPVEPNPSPLCWEAPSPAASCTVAGPCGSEDSTQAGECEVSGSWSATTLTCKPSSANCAFYKSKVPPPSLCWQKGSSVATCSVSGSCSPLNSTDNSAMCKDSSGNWLKNQTVTCKDSSSGFCTLPGSCDSSIWDSNKTAAEICDGSSETQTNQCGDSRIVAGSKTDGVCAPPASGCRIGHPLTWTGGGGANLKICSEYFLSPTGSITYQNVAEGYQESTNSGFCASGGSCNGTMTWKCEGGTMKILSKSCVGGSIE